jgi:polyisoprenoid-binding protein YceI
MQEHFNENFMESATYPKAYYRGKITGFSAEALSSVPMKLRVAGELTIHGVSRKVETMASLSLNGDTIRMTSEFIAKPEDYKIKVPRILFNKIAEEVNVLVNLELLSGNPAGG